MMTTEHKLEDIKRKMKRQLEKGQNCEKTNDIYRQLLKDSKYYENQFKPKDYGRTTNN
jgi:hypothetical protein